MSIATSKKRSSSTETIAEIVSCFDRLWPLLRSLTGAGARKTHDILSDVAPFEQIEVPSGTTVFDWIVPKEWLVREAYVIAPDGRRILDVQENNLHLLNYSVGFSGEVDRAELDLHLHSKPELPDAIPYVTSYYVPRWGFCISERQRRALPPGRYRVQIDAEHVDGAMTLSEAVLPGRESDEVLLTSYSCHPSMANDELCGPLVLAFLYRRIAAWPKRRLTYRFALHPETIGALTYLRLRGEHLRRALVAGYVVTNVGVAAPFRYKRSRRGDEAGDRAAVLVLGGRPGPQPIVSDFEPLGSDERQYCSPGFDLPVGVVSRTPNHYPEYHTSLDNRDFISFEAVAESLDACESICLALDGGAGSCRAECLSAAEDAGDAGPRYRNLLPYGEPQLGRRGLYPTIGRSSELDERFKALLWVLNLSDGRHSLPQIARRSQLPLDSIRAAAESCLDAGLLEPVAGATLQ